MEMDSVQSLPLFCKRPRCLDDPFFEDGNLICNMHSKYFTITKKVALEIAVFPTYNLNCDIGSCSQVFSSITEFEAHYNTLHRHVCSQCRRHFCSSHLLDIHVLEAHDTFFLLLATKKPMYECLVKGCSILSWSSQERKEHLIECHHYPANFRFELQLHRRKCSEQRLPKKSNSCSQRVAHVTTMDVDQSFDSVGSREVDDRNGAVAMTNANSASTKVFSYKVPNQICFGKDSRKCFSGANKRKKLFRQHWHQTQCTDTNISIEDVNMTELVQSLPNS